MGMMTISQSKGGSELRDGRLPLAAPDSVNSKVKSSSGSRLERRTECCFNELLLSTSNSAPPAGTASVSKKWQAACVRVMDCVFNKECISQCERVLNET